MKGFILSKRRQSELTEDQYSILRLLEAASHLGIDLKAYAPEEFDLVTAQENKETIIIRGKSEPLPDFILQRTGSETSFLGLSLLRQLENQGVYCCNSSRSIENTKDKLRMAQLLTKSALPHPKTMYLNFPPSIERVREEIGFPLVIKNITGTRGAGVFLCETEDRFWDVIRLVHSFNSQANMILQEFIETSFGRDVRVFVIGDTVAGCMLRKSKTSFKANFSMGGSVEPFPVSEEVRELGVQTARILGLEVAGIDLLFGKKGFAVCEANSSPGFSGMEQVVGKQIAELILKHIRARIKLVSASYVFK